MKPSRKTQSPAALAASACSASDYANILEALGSIVETRCYLQKMRRLSEEGPLPDWTAITENLQGALRESEVVLTRVQKLYNSKRETPNDQDRQSSPTARRRWWSGKETMKEPETIKRKAGGRLGAATLLGVMVLATGFCSSSIPKCRSLCRELYQAGCHQSGGNGNKPHFWVAV